MALSEREQRLLDEMERGLYQEDADFVAAGGRRGAPNYVAVTIGVLVALVGLAGAVIALAAQLPIVGIVGFAVMVLGVLFTFRRRKDAPGVSTPSRPAPKAKGGSRVMGAFEDRWEQRQRRDDR